LIQLLTVNRELGESFCLILIAGIFVWKILKRKKKPSDGSKEVSIAEIGSFE
jgi:hypothetical protein